MSSADKEEKESFSEEDSSSADADAVAALEEKLLRLQAEMENNRKRLERERERVRDSAIEGFARELLKVLDDIRRAQASWSEKELDSSVAEGLALILTSSEQMLARYGIKRIEAKGRVFDPNFHEALFEDKDSAAAAGTITQIIEEGYMFGERLLRAARVAVASSKESPEKPSSEQEKEGKE